MISYNILIIYHHNGRLRLRATNADAVWAFARHTRHRCFYFNTVDQPLPDWLLRVRFDLIVFHTLFTAEKWTASAFTAAREKVIAVKSLECMKICMAQDEFLNSNILCDFVAEFGIDHLFVLTPPKDWPNLYGRLDSSKVTIHQMLAGYLEPRTIARVSRMRDETRFRPIDIGYRAWRTRPWLGRHAQLKWRIAEEAQRVGPGLGLKLDISIRDEDVFFGDDWYRFLLRCKSVIGVEGGASLADPDGSLRDRTESYLEAHPDASFEEVEAACFPGLDGRLNLQVITPRHLECCVTKTCQILVEGAYNGILRPEEHYIPVRNDFSNLTEVLLRSQDQALRHRLTKNAYRDIVDSGLYSYPHFMQELMGVVVADLRRLRLSPTEWARSSVLCHILAAHQWWSWECRYGRVARLQVWWEEKANQLGLWWERAIVAWNASIGHKASFLGRSAWHRLLFLLQNPREGARRATAALRDPRSSAYRLMRTLRSS